MIFKENLTNWLGCFFAPGIVEEIETRFEECINFLYSESFFDTNIAGSDCAVEL